MVVVVRDKGAVPLDNPDAKVFAVRDEVTGNIAACFLDLSQKKFSLWYQPSGWVAERIRYGSIDLTDAVLAVHDGHAKLLAVTWRNTSPDGRAHFVVLDLGALY